MQAAIDRRFYVKQNFRNRKVESEEETIKTGGKDPQRSEANHDLYGSV